MSVYVSWSTEANKNHGRNTRKSNIQHTNGYDLKLVPFITRSNQLIHLTYFFMLSSPSLLCLLREQFPIKILCSFLVVATYPARTHTILITRLYKSRNLSLYMWILWTARFIFLLISKYFRYHVIFKHSFCNINSKWDINIVCISFYMHGERSGDAS